MRTAQALGLALLLMSGASPAMAEEPVPPASPSDAITLAGKQRARGDVDAAIGTLKAGMKAFPDDQRLRHALAFAYLEDENEFWALKVLRSYEEEHPPACDARALQAWIHMREANFELAEEILATPGCDTPDYVHARHLLLRAKMAAQKGDEEEARALVKQARQAGRYYEEDEALLRSMTQRFEPGRMPLLSWRVDLATGWTSNGLAGSPVDPADAGIDTATYLTQLDASMRMVIPASRSVRPVLEAQVRALDLGAQTVAALSYRQPSIRPGVLFGETYPRLLLTYGFDAVQIASSDRYEGGPLWYSEGHRVDYELEATPNLYAFGGGGHRWYREAGRTRWEAEQGLAVGHAFGTKLRTMAGASARWYRAANEAYDAFGGTLLAQVGYRLPWMLEGRLNASISYEDYPRSHGYFPGSEGEKRTDVLLRFKPGLWSPSWHGLRVGLDWEHSRRDSTAENYAYTDDRVLGHVVWVMDGDRFGVETIPTEGREPIPHDVAASGQAGSEEMQIRDLMRQDEAVKRGSSCLN